MIYHTEPIQQRHRAAAAAWDITGYGTRQPSSQIVIALKFNYKKILNNCKKFP